MIISGCLRKIAFIYMTCYIQMNDNHTWVTCGLVGNGYDGYGVCLPTLKTFQ